MRAHANDRQTGRDGGRVSGWFVGGDVYVGDGVHCYAVVAAIVRVSHTFACTLFASNLYACMSAMAGRVFMLFQWALFMQRIHISRLFVF